jgi:hypothetical protein
VSATAGSALTPDHLERIQAEMNRVLDAPESAKVARWTMFSSRPVEGSWRYHEQFQIVPAPADAPKPEELIAEHPFLVDFVFNDSSNWNIQRIRLGRRAADLMLVLNLLLTSHITAPSVRSRKHWVWAAQGSTPPVMWTGEGYMIPRFQYLVDDFPDTKSPSLEELPADSYYDRVKGYSDTLKIPSELTDLLDSFHALTSDDHNRFLRACYWFHMASTMWDYSQSLYLTCLINSIECLSSVGRQRPMSEAPSSLFKAFMGRFAPRKPAEIPSTPGPSALFRSIMRKFAPGPPSGSLIDRIYDARSKITHGERLLSLDQQPGSSSLSQVSTGDRDIGDAAWILCRGALVNWLWSHTPRAGTRQLIARGLKTEEPARRGTKSGVTIIVPGAEE